MYRELYSGINDAKPTNRNGQYLGRCPYPNHEDKKPSFSYNVNNGMYNCHGCGEKGDAYKRAQFLGINPKPYSRNGDTAYKMNPLKPRPEQIKLEPITPTLPPLLNEEYCNKILEYQEHFAKHQKKLNLLPTWIDKFIQELSVGYDPHNKCLTYTHSNENFEPINIRYHKSEDGKPPRSIDDHGKSVLYPLPLIVNFNFDQQILFAEGETDTGTLFSNGYQAVTSSNGALSTPEDLSPLAKATKVLFVYDNDDAGEKGSTKTALELKRQYPDIKVGICHWLSDYPQGYDVTDHVKTGGDMDELLLNVEYITDIVEPEPDLAPPPPKPVRSIFIDSPKDFHEWVNDDTPKPIDFINGILPIETVIGIVSAENVGKTILGLNIAMCLSSGHNWIGHTILKPRRVLYLLAEGGKWNAGERAKIMSKHPDINPPPGNFMLRILNSYDVQNPYHHAELTAEIESYQPEVIFIDTLIKAHTANENDNGEMQRVFDIFRGFTTGKGRSMVVLHHIAKGALGGSRGASSINGDFDTIINLDWLKRNNTVSTTERVISFTKVRHAERPPDETVLIDRETLFLEHTDADTSTAQQNKLLSYFKGGQSFSRNELKDKLMMDFDIQKRRAQQIIHTCMNDLKEKGQMLSKK
jgi:hypothetical protein